MTRVDQHRMIMELRSHSARMGREDLDQLEMFLKRDKDDEDLDVLSVRRLDQLFQKYVQKKSKKDIEELWKKMTGGKEGR